MAIPSELRPWRGHVLVNAALLGSGLAAILLAVACVQLLLPLDRSAMRAHPLYWVALVPAAAWAGAAANFSGWAIRWFLRATIAIAAASGLLVVMLHLGGDRIGGGHVLALALIASILAGASAAVAGHPAFRQFVNAAGL